MIEVERVMTLNHPMTDVVGFLADFANTEMWDPGTVTCDRIDDGPLSVGAEWRNVSVFRGRRTELRYRLTRLDPDHLVFVGRNKTATSTDDLSFTEQAGRTRLTYRARLEFRGIARLAAPLLKREFERLGDEVAEQLPKAVDHALEGSGEHRRPPRTAGH
ncbi:SRPBCC family protein [Streptomyces heilongjiangensis]|uniref:SRPBCC family protein n=1 Tax=Streptomyces heilongjiangensis TaxID=945052 RepID=A0ABW1B043_9ACTN|nr:SRPBCC family protein [Streptomyces heilongjiangensis]MDC2946495.1 SRPBCC family protein [Streptomyces heilongjiangensis]